MIAILDTAGNQVVQYTYDAWGNILTTTGTLANTLGALNPITYRGYVYDTETGLYYLQSRYYNPTIGKFLNADALVSTGQGFLGNNMFAYCLNNPTSGIDPCGKWTMGFSIGANITAIFGFSISIGIYWDDEGNVDWQWSYSAPGVDDTANIGILDAGISAAVQYTNADAVYDLYGPATYIGASGGPSWYVGADVISFDDASDLDGAIDGVQLVGGIGFGVDVHVMETYTRPVGKPDNSTNNSGSAVRPNKMGTLAKTFCVTHVCW